MTGLQAVYRVLSWAAWAVLLVTITSLIPFIYRYTLEWHLRPTFSDTTVPTNDPYLLAIINDINPLGTIIISFIPISVLLAALGFYWRRLSLCQHTIDTPLSWASSFLSLSSAFLIWLHCGRLGHNLSAWHASNQLPHGASSSFLEVLGQGLLIALPLIIIMLSAKALLRTWARWQGLNHITH